MIGISASMRPLAVAFSVAAMATSADSSGNAANSASTETLFRETCSACHPAARATDQRHSQEEWQQIVARMRGHAEGSSKAFSQKTAEAIVAYLAREDAAADASETSSAPANTEDTVSGHEPEHENTFTELGEALGIVTAVLVLGMIGSGLSRRKLKKRFRPVHATMACLLLATVIGHGMLLYLHHGPPRSLWHLSGTLGLLTLLATAGGGVLRRKLGRSFLKLHMAGAFTTAVLIVLHRLLAG